MPGLPMRSQSPLPWARGPALTLCLSSSPLPTRCLHCPEPCPRVPIAGGSLHFGSLLCEAPRGSFLTSGKQVRNRECECASLQKKKKKKSAISSFQTPCILETARCDVTQCGPCLLTLDFVISETRPGGLGLPRLGPASAWPSAGRPTFPAATALVDVDGHVLSKGASARQLS